MNVEMNPATALVQSEKTKTWSAVLRWPLTVQLYLLGVIVLYAPVLADALQQWLHDEYQAHGLFIPPICLGLLWLQREQIRALKSRPSAWGLAPLAIGLLLRAGAWLLRVDTQFLNMWSLVLVLAGSVLILHGRALWRLVAFPVLFLLTAGGIPDKVTQPVSALLQRVSSQGGALIMKALGLPIIQTGNLIEVPGCRLEVADVCSGIKKMVALIAFSLLYGYLFQISGWRRIALVVITIPIAVFANTIRVAGLIGVTWLGGVRALNIAHDWAEIIVLIIAFFLFLGAGKLLGCKTLRFSL